jgi:hypothetical protein
MKDKEYSQKILGLSRGIFNGSFNEREQELVVEAMREYTKGNYTRIDEIFQMVGNDYQLLAKLMEKLKGKSVHDGIKNLLEGRDQSNEQAIISTASLISHVAIEMKENKRYGILLPDLYRKLGVLINKQELK